MCFYHQQKSLLLLGGGYLIDAVFQSYVKRMSGKGRKMTSAVPLRQAQGEPAGLGHTHSDESPSKQGHPLRDPPHVHSHVVP